MDVANYYITTLTNAGANIFPIMAFLALGYFIFFKLPFSVFLKVLKENKTDPVVADHEEQERREAALGLDAPEAPQRPAGERKRKTQSQDSKQTAGGQRSDRKEHSRPRPRTSLERPQKPTLEEEIFQLAAGERISKTQLKRRYHELLKSNHPDKVASLDGEARLRAELKTKAINLAYQKLKGKAA